MLKRMIALCLVIAMLVPLSSAVAADATSAPPTVEEILSEYHRKAFEAQTQGETSAASTWSRRGTEKTLEQETVDILTEAGYEAYNVTADNYDTLEAELQTDFADMGLDRDGSYIIVISGKEENIQSGHNSRSGDDIVQDDGGLGGTNNFEYTYRGITYTMRYLKVTNADNPDYFATDTTPLISASRDAALINDSLNSLIYFFLDCTTDNPLIGLGTVSDILGIEFANIHLQYPVSLSLTTTVNWSPVYTQVYDEASNMWSCRSCVDYVQIINWYTGSYYNKTSGPEYIDKTVTSNIYTEHYLDFDWRIHRAAMGVWYSTHYYEYIDDVSIYNPLEEMTLNNMPDRIFYFIRPIVVPPHSDGDTP